jgi:hypothetical protein
MMKKKMKRFQDGGVADENFTPAQLEFLGGADRTDPYILARMRSKFPDAPKEMQQKESFATAEGQNKNIGDDVRARAMKSISTDTAPVAKPKKTAPAKTVPAKAEVKKEVVVEKAKEEPKKTVRKTIPSDFGKVSLPKSFAASGRNTEPKKSTARLSPVDISLPDPLAKFKKQKSSEVAYSDAGYKKGGMVSSASKRADGCAVRGKTRA